LLSSPSSILFFTHPVMFALLGLPFLTLVAAQFPFNITNPDSNHWFVSNSMNTIAWTPCTGALALQHPLFTVVVRNQDQSIIPGNLSEIGAVPTTDCSKSFTPTNMPVGTGYTMFLEDSTTAQVIAVSELFEVKPVGSAYPTSSSSAANGPTASSGSAPQASGTSGNGTSSAPKSGAASLMLSSQKGLGLVAGLAGFAVTALL